MPNHIPTHRNKGKEGSFMDFGGADVNQEFIGRNQKFVKYRASHWLSHSSLPLAELFPGKEELFLLSLRQSSGTTPCCRGKVVFSQQGQ